MSPKILILTIMIILVIMATPVSFGEVKDIHLTATSPSEIYYEGTYPLIIGKVKDHQGQPIQGAQIFASMYAQPIKTTTDYSGSYTLKSPVPAKIGPQTVNVVVMKNGSSSTTSTMFIVKQKLTPTTDNSLGIHEAIKTIPKSIEMIPKMVEKEMTTNPISNEILRQMEAQKQFIEQETQRLSNEQYLEEQRKFAQQLLEKDLASLERTHQPNSPRNAFASFVSKVDSSIQGVFWGQFEVTETLTEDARNAKLEALRNGKTSEQAMNVFQRKAAITHDELVEYNKNLNIKYGLANSDIQNKFDEQGKLPREK